MIRMPDSTAPGNIPLDDARQAVLGYADGRWPTAPRLRVLFPGARVVALTVTGATLEADGVDCEEGNPDAASAARWVQRKLAGDPSSRPVVYADLETRGYSMTEVLAELATLGIGPERVRKLTAHYAGKHICSPAHGCRDAGGKVITFTADGTQWTDAYAGLNGTKIDMSALDDDFFGAAPTPAPTANWTEALMAAIPVIRKGDHGQAVKNWQALLLANGYSLAPYGDDGSFGPLTDDRTRKFQENHRIGVDGIVGRETWTAALAV